MPVKSALMAIKQVSDINQSIVQKFIKQPIFTCICLQTKFTNPTMHMSHIPQCIIQNRNVHISVLNGALWDIGQVQLGICEASLLEVGRQNIPRYIG